MQPIFLSNCHWADIVNRIKKRLAAQIYKRSSRDGCSLCVILLDK
ncbi:hypothetical protein EUBSIR_01493 [[Eubacterium] siraeum DSM 15702]|uniref:Uncharacterized protein n=1 Tax=[Eubacterium] siraeum DSM 15702 TaxID=428128 RepID=B0MNT6_9FIRM|nr:hypothetical protein EUBSIR_01493 [[Eubacterium] siraeum DSM 15702]